MPTHTFLNLPEAKRQRLLQSAKTEFARKPYGEVSLNRIICGAGIPRGSFYQYFSDKTELFRYILLQYTQQLNSIITSNLETCHGNLFVFPFQLFDYISGLILSNSEEFQIFLAIIRQNMEFNIGQITDLSRVETLILSQIDQSNLTVHSPEELLALLKLLLLVTGQLLMASVICGKLSIPEARERLTCTVNLIRHGAEVS